MKNKFISNRVIKLNDGTIFFTSDKEPSVACDWTIFFTSDKNRPTRDEIYFIDFWRENLSMYRINIKLSEELTQTISEVLIN